MALITTIGGAASDSYISLSDADVYWAAHGTPSEWDDATKGMLEAALRYATQYLDQTFSWKSTISSTTQSLGWDRASYTDSEGRTIGGAGVIPQKIADATCEIAIHYLREDFTSSDSDNIESEKLGEAEVKYRSGGNAKSFSFVKVMLREYGSTDKSSNPRLYRG